MRKLQLLFARFFNIVPSRYLDGFGITGKTVLIFYRTLVLLNVNKEHTHSYLNLEQCNLRVLRGVHKQVLVMLNVIMSLRGGGRLPM